jgi:hypothetical protein
MSADKRRGEARRMRLLRNTCDPATCAGIPPHGRIYLNVEGGTSAKNADLQRLAEDGYLRLRRVYKSDNARRSCYVLTPKGWRAKASGSFE